MPFSGSGASTTIIMRNANLWSVKYNVYAASVDIVFYRPKIRIPYIKIVEAPLSEEMHGVEAHLYILSQNFKMFRKSQSRRNGEYYLLELP
jgi:hypothetical protein